MYIYISTSTSIQYEEFEVLDRQSLTVALPDRLTGVIGGTVSFLACVCMRIFGTSMLSSENAKKKMTKIWLTPLKRILHKREHIKMNRTRKDIRLLAMLVHKQGQHGKQPLVSLQADQWNWKVMHDAVAEGYFIWLYLGSDISDI